MCEKLNVENVAMLPIDKITSPVMQMWEFSNDPFHRKIDRKT